MKRMHIHVGVASIDEAVRFYSALFGVAPVKTKTDYAKWMLDDPRINFAISTRASLGVDHLGLQVDEEVELEELRNRLQQAETAVFHEGETVCCYARSDKSWVKDPAGVPWEAYRTLEDVQLFAADAQPGKTACCQPEPKAASGCCARA
ncbi:MAG: hypothetical protein RLZZ385_2111 [Pseudomonadota bacterium]|jgi:catechol 2,3-dioxygenase-like lactoylglutathione lyase family enzyme